MYDYRRMTPEERRAIVADRLNRGFPRHSPPHLEVPGEFRIVSGTCFEHRKLLNSHKRLGWFEEQLLNAVAEVSAPYAAWCVLPNHYHVLVKIADMKVFSKCIGQLHGRSSFQMNRDDDTRGRQVWHRFQDRCMRSEGHYHTTLNYIHNNPRKHGYVEKWQDWPFSSVHWYLATKGRDWLRDLWLSHPVFDYGEKWDL
ncbi:MAG: transposase [Candidatus Nealsonbacteria bacterium]|nr:transposase [Candidatus Nealsonbacteria bacterium]